VKGEVCFYTVILLYPDYATDDYGTDVYMEWARVRAELPQQDQFAHAVRIVRGKAHKANPHIKAEDFALVMLMGGRIQGLADGYSGY